MARVPYFDYILAVELANFWYFYMGPFLYDK